LIIYLLSPQSKKQPKSWNNFGLSLALKRNIEIKSPLFTSTNNGGMIYGPIYQNHASLFQVQLFIFINSCNFYIPTMKSRETELILTYLFIDLCILNIAILSAGCLNSYESIWNNKNLAAYLLLANLACILSYIIFPKKNLYIQDGFKYRFSRITRRTIVFLIISGIIEFLIMPTVYIKYFLFEFSLYFYAGKLIFYKCQYCFLKISRNKGLDTNRALVMGINKTGLHLRRLIDNNPLLGYKFVGYVAENAINEQDVLGHPDNLSDLIDQHKVQMVFVTLSLFGGTQRDKEYLRICNKKGIRLRFITENQRWVKSGVHLESVGSLAVVNPQEIPLDAIESRLFKRVFDLIFSGLIIVCIFWWLFPILAVAIKLSSHGPVFFVQKRSGINNKVFNCLKFRSMQVNQNSDNLQATVGDVRITRIGNFMRRTNMDELPQFFNVFIGQMSVSGPRPHMLKHTNQYTKLIDHYMVRHYVKPGVTGWAQVNGLRGETDELWKMEERVKFDIEYLENWTFWWDLKIIFLTLVNKKSFKNAG